MCHPFLLGTSTRVLTLLQKNYLPRPFQNPLRGGHKYKPPRLMHGINRGGRFFLTEAVTRNHLVKSINGGDYYKRARLQK